MNGFIDVHLGEFIECQDVNEAWIKKLPVDLYLDNLKNGCVLNISMNSMIYQILICVLFTCSIFSQVSTNSFERQFTQHVL